MIAKTKLCIEMRILKNFKEEFKKYKQKTNDSLILQWFKSKNISKTVHTFNTFQFNVEFIGTKDKPKYTGFGILIYPSEIPFSKCYIGSFRKGKRHGRGWRLMDTTIYDGNYKMDRKHGKAKMWTFDDFKQTLIFDGSYMDGKMNGHCFVKDDDHEFVGQVHSGLYHGQCKIKYPNGDCYTGSMFRGEMSGKCVIEYANGDKYVGQLFENKRTGEGNYIWNSKNFGQNFSSNLSTTNTSEQERQLLSSRKNKSFRFSRR
jgi:hypothetical protein